MARTKRPFDPSDKTAAEAQLRAKFTPDAVSRLLTAARRFLLSENSPWRRHLNDERLEKVDDALKTLIASIKELPYDLQVVPPAEPRMDDIPRRLREPLREASRKYAEAEATPNDEEGRRRRDRAMHDYGEAHRHLGLMPLEAFLDVLATWRAALRIEGNEPDPTDIESILAARTPQVRFADHMTRRLARYNPDLTGVSGRDLALLAVCSGFEEHKPDADFDLVIDRWKKALSRAEEILEESKARKLRERATDYMQRLRLVMAGIGRGEFDIDAGTAYREWKTARDALKQLDEQATAPRPRRRAARRPR